MKTKIFLLLSLFSLGANAGLANKNDSHIQPVASDTLTVSETEESFETSIPELQHNDTTSVNVVEKKPKGILKPIHWLRKYFQNANKGEDKRFDCSILFGPSYKATTSVTIGGGITGLYKWDRKDSTLQKSNVNSFFTASIKGMLKMSVSGRNFFKGDRNRLDYEFYIMNMPTDFWGLGYLNGANNDNVGSYDQLKISFHPNYFHRFAKNFYAGLGVRFQHIHSFDFTHPHFLGDFDKDITSTGAGIVVQYDSRDFTLNAKRGNYFRLEQMYFPKGLNHYDFHSTNIIYSAYRRMWKSGVVALDLHGLLNYGNNVPWTMYAMVGQNGRMRGYYEGRYRDRNILEGQVEVRQHLVKRFGLAVWAGAANVFPDFKQISLKQILPNYGVGFRWEFKKNVNIRFDLGFTKNKPNVEFGLGEAF